MFTIGVGWKNRLFESLQWQIYNLKQLQPETTLTVEIVFIADNTACICIHQIL